MKQTKAELEIEVKRLKKKLLDKNLPNRSD